MGGRFNSSSVGSAETARCDWPAFARCHLVPSPRVRQRDVAVALGFPLPASPHPRRADAAPSRRAQRRARARRRSPRPRPHTPQRRARPASTRRTAPRSAPSSARGFRVTARTRPVRRSDGVPRPRRGRRARGRRPSQQVRARRAKRAIRRKARDLYDDREGRWIIHREGAPRGIHPSLRGIHSIDPPSSSRSDRALFVGGAYRLLASASHPPHPAPLVPVLIIIPPTHPPSPFPLPSAAAPPGHRRHAGRRLPRGASLTRCPHTRA
jgi:hypothetical protein